MIDLRSEQLCELEEDGIFQLRKSKKPKNSYWMDLELQEESEFKGGEQL